MAHGKAYRWKVFSFFLASILLTINHSCDSSVKASKADIDENKIIVSHHNFPPAAKRDLSPHIQLIVNVKNDTDYAVLQHPYKKKNKNERFRKKKEKSEKINGYNTRSNKRQQFKMIETLRNNEKTTLIRNKTMEILKNGVRILGGSKDYSTGSIKTSNYVNESLLGKILSSAASKSDMLISSSGAYQLHIGSNFYKSKEPTSTSTFQVKYINRIKTSLEPQLSEKMKSPDVFERNRKNETPRDGISDNEYIDESAEVKDSDTRRQFNGSFKISGHESFIVNGNNNIKTVLEQINETLKNLTRFTQNENNDCFCEENSSPYTKEVHPDDPCTKWLKCKNQLEKIFIVQNILPSCPCLYPSAIFYNNAVWDENRNRLFRWRDASNEAERLDIYKPGAAYCIRSLPAQGGASISSQQCCYDRELRLLTRGSGAGTINFVSPDVSKSLHDTVDTLPWRLCKGDFTRYNLARYPDNGNRCPINPNEELYQLQVESSKYF